MIIVALLLLFIVKSLICGKHSWSLFTVVPKIQYARLIKVSYDPTRNGSWDGRTQNSTHSLNYWMHHQKHGQGTHSTDPFVFCRPITQDIFSFHMLHNQLLQNYAWAVHLICTSRPKYFIHSCMAGGIAALAFCRASEPCSLLPNRPESQAT